MSGIAGIIRLDGSPVVASDVAAMLAPMERRGPDGLRKLAQGGVGFGHALLATTPEATAELQPWTHRETGCIVVSDSRLDNRQELLKMLGSPVPADLVGDGELLHAAYERWGSDCAQKLLGDFAFALWDPRRQVLFCARDIMGVRPFYYHHVPGRLFAFASECEALLTIAGVSGDIDEGRVVDALIGETEGIDRISTFYPAISRLPPARVLVLDRQTFVHTEYWQPLPDRPDDLPKSDDEWACAVGSTLREAVRCRLRGSARVGSMLSGGLDSSSVSALAHELRESTGGERFATISAIDSQGRDAETSAIHAMLASRDFDAILVDLRNMGETVSSVRAQLQALREPFDGTMTLVSAVYAAASSSGIRCVLDGVPADNLYSVGPWYQQLARAGRLPTFWREVRAMHAGQGAARPDARTARTLVTAFAPRSLRHWRERMQGDHYMRSLANASFINQDRAPGTAPGERYRRMRADMHATRLHNRDWTAQSIMTAAYITAGVERYNRVATHFGVEPRHPFLDRRMIELHAWLPPSLRLRNGQYKWVLRHAMGGLLPADVAWRRDKLHLGYKFSDAMWGGVSWPEDLPIHPVVRSSIGRSHLHSIKLGSAQPQTYGPARGAALIRGLSVLAWATKSNFWSSDDIQEPTSQI